MIKHKTRQKKKGSFKLIKLALELIPVKTTHNLYTGRQNVFKNSKQDRQVELLFTVERSNYSNKSAQPQ